MIGFKTYLRRSNISFLDDKLHRETALEICFSSALQSNRPLSMVDCLIRLILEDMEEMNIKVNCLATFNIADFFDICQKRRVEIIGVGDV